MKTPTSITFRKLSLAALAVCALGIGALAQAANHALIMTIDYSGTKAELPGIDKDGDAAVKIAEGMGVPRQNIKWLRNRDLTMGGMSAAIQDLTQNRIADGDKVFMYYSGHGYQTSGSGSKCTESLVTSDLKFFEDERLRQALDTLAAKASQVVMFNDSCFSGGAATKDMSQDADGSVPKLYVDEKSGPSTDSGYACGQATNKDFGARTLGVVARQRSIQILYVAASSDSEVSRASQSGSWATQAWAACLSGRTADRDGNGIVDGNELRQCSQSFIDKRFPKPQTVTLVGNKSLPLSFGGSVGAAPTPVVNPSGTLETLRAAADPGIKLDLSVTKSRLTIGRDLLDFSVSSQRDGYLYLLHVASDGKFFVLFPNKLDTNNYFRAGTQRFPRPSWGIQAQGPVGTSYVMAYLSASPKEFTKGLESDGPFATGEANSDTTRKLGVVALTGRYGTSAVAAIQEIK